VRFVFVAATAETGTESHRRDHPPQGESAERPLTNGGPGACRNHRIGAGPGRRAADTLAERGAHVHLTGTVNRGEVLNEQLQRARHSHGSCATSEVRLRAG
jgi:hypothetical protein